MTITFAPPGGEPRAVRINRGTLLQLLDQGRLRLLEDGTFTLDDDDESDDDDDDDGRGRFIDRPRARAYQEAVDAILPNNKRASTSPGRLRSPKKTRAPREGDYRAPREDD